MQVDLYNSYKKWFCCTATFRSICFIFSALTLLAGWQEGHPACLICLQRGADLHMAQLMPPPLTVSCFSEIQIGFTFLVPAHLGSTGKRAIKRVCVCVALSQKVTILA